MLTPMLQGAMVLALGAALTGPTAPPDPTESQATPTTVPVSAPAPTAAPNAEHRLISALGLAGGVRDARHVDVVRLVQGQADPPAVDLRR